jgi:hypothetical protein
MSAILRAYGDHFNVDAFLAGCTLPVCAVKRRGEPIFPVSKPDGKRHTQSGVHVVASDADFHEFLRSVEEAILFLKVNGEEVRRLCEFPGVEGVTLDFGIARRDTYTQSDRLPAELVSLAGSMGLAIELSQYPVDESVGGEVGDPPDGSAAAEQAAVGLASAGGYDDDMSDQPSPRRRFQFRLRSLMIVVTLLAIPLGYVGWQAKIVRKRNAMLENPRVANSIRETVDGKPMISWLRRLLGDQDYAEIYVGGNVSAEEITNYRLAFPEAEVHGDD